MWNWRRFDVFGFCLLKPSYLPKQHCVRPVSTLMRRVSRVVFEVMHSTCQYSHPLLLDPRCSFDCFFNKGSVIAMPTQAARLKKCFATITETDNSVPHAHTHTNGETKPTAAQANALNMRPIPTLGEGEGERTARLWGAGDEGGVLCCCAADTLPSRAQHSRVQSATVSAVLCRGWRSTGGKVGLGARKRER